MADKDETSRLSRRKFIKKSSYVAGGIVGGGVLGTIIGTNFPGQETKVPTNKGTKSDKSYNQALMYFSRPSDFQTLSAATERIFPKDENGPGAIELSVPYFIDHQLAGSYGHNEREYMKGPFFSGTDYQGIQSPLKRHEIFMVGIRALEDESKKEYDASFVDLDDDQQDKILERFENNDVTLKGVMASYFFEQLRAATLSGAYADPLYGGNENMDGWRMKQFPGNQMSYLKEIDSDKFIEIEPESLKDHQA